MLMQEASLPLNKLQSYTVTNKVAVISNSQPNLFNISGSDSGVAVDSRCLCFEETRVLQNVGNYLPIGMA
jgi:hypothetical protein